MSRSRALAAAAVLAAGVTLAGCGQVADQFLGNPDATPPPRARVAAGPGLAAADAYFRDHPVKMPKGMQAGILIRSVRPGALCALNGCTWRGVVVVPGGWTERLASDGGDDGMQNFADPGDLIEFPARAEPVDAPGDEIASRHPAKLLERGAVNVP